MGRGLVNGVSARYNSLKGQRFGRLLVKEDVGRDKHKSVLWLCECECGNEKTVDSQSLRRGHTTSCGCFRAEVRGSYRFVDLTGHKFGRLTVLSRGGTSSSNKIKWLTRCQCGAEKEIIGASLTSGLTNSCGCHLKEIRTEIAKTHGMSYTSEFKAWTSMIARCTYPSATGYKNYGGRGITVCVEWSESFLAFYRDIGPKPSASHSLDRYPDVDGNYEPGNVRWATSVDQARNKRNTMFITHDGEEKSLVEWCEKLGLHYGTVNSRIRKLGWEPAEALGLAERRAA